MRRGREHLADSGSPRWITRTWFSRTARDDDWWAAFTRGDVPRASPEKPRPTRSRAYILLAALGRATPALSLSAKDCEDLAPLLTEWLVRGATDEYVLRSLTEGLPVPVHSPAALLRRRLTTKLPPEPPHQEPAPRPPLRVLECAKCGTPGRPEALPGGICALCRGEAGPTRPPALLPASAVHTRANGIRAAMADRREGMRT